jgi:hypothetical protein
MFEAETSSSAVLASHSTGDHERARSALIEFRSMVEDVIG